MKNAKNVMCITGGPGMGKTEVALEFEHRYSHRYKMVIWVGGEFRYLRQHLLNLSLDLELDVSVDV
ncbi:putative P-loop containing nucleoside triphosphate hydrolase [Helianthus debilis subsp. tardiflorus]